MANDNLYNDISIFDAEYYLANNPLLAAALEEAGVSAQVHYYLYGAAESAEGGVDGELRLPNAWFDIDFYRTTKPGLEDVPANELLAHFALHGSKELLAPNPAYADEDGKLKVAELAAYLEANPGVKEAVAEMTGTPVGAELTPEQASIAAFHFFTYGIEQGLSGGIADIKPVNPIEPDETDSLTEALTAYQDALSARTDFLNDNAENELLENTAIIQGLADGETATAAQVVTAIEQANTAAESAVENAEGALQDATDALDVARAAKFGTSDAVTALKSITPDTLMRDATLEAARVEAQTAVEDDTNIYTASGHTAADAGLVALALVDGKLVVDASAETVGYAGVVTPGDASADAGTDGDAVVNIGTTADGFTGSLTLTFIPDGDTEATTVVLTIEDGKVTKGTTEDVTVDEAGTTITITGLEASATAAVSGEYAYTEASLVDTFTAAELQENIALAEAALSTDEESNGDNVALLSAVRDAINAHIGAGGENNTITSVDGATDLLALRTKINGELNAEPIVDATVAALVNSIAQADLEITAAEGEQLTAQEKALNTAFANIETRVALESDVADAENAFNNTETGAILDIILGLQEARQGLIDEVQDAEDALEAAEGIAAEIAALVTQLETLDGDIESTEAKLTDSEEDGGFGLTLLPFESGAATEGDDLFVFTAEDGKTIDITQFGEEGEDRIFFGDNYKFFELTADQSITDRVGSVDELEIFWKAGADGITLYVESDAAAGYDTGVNATNEITTIELVGVDSVALENGFLTTGTEVA